MPRRTCGAAQFLRGVSRAGVLDCLKHPRCRGSFPWARSNLLAGALGAPVIAGLIGFFFAVVLYPQPQNAEEACRLARCDLQYAQRKILRGRIVRRHHVRPSFGFSDKVLWRVVDEGVIEGTVNGVAPRLPETGDRLRYASTGTYHYAAWIWVGAVVFTSSAAVDGG